jgi:MoxR-like ATPase
MSKTNQFEWFLDRSIRKPHVPIAFVGDPGTGKTAQVEKWAKRRGLPMVKLLASTLEESDVAGIVVRDGDHAKTLSPQWYLSLKDNPGVLFLDEINTCRKEVADTLLTLVCSRHLPNGDRLHDGVLIIAAMNDHEQCDNYELSPAMRTRFMWIKHEKRWYHLYSLLRENLDDCKCVPLPI